MIFFGPKKREPCVLVADDDIVVRSVIGNVIETEGYRILEAGSGQEAVEMARKEQPLLIVMDINMPGMDGIEATAALRADPKTAQIPILVCSAHGTFDNVEKCLTLGARDFLMKPFDSAVLLKKVRDIIAKAQKPQ
ncbi:MAG TPA: two-component system response regulator [Elusimicrobia bacterium]|nr:two-component system response regulator [Elusimicrobiota bacterium]